jgi:ubiquinone biosynthesis protein
LIETRASLWRNSLAVGSRVARCITVVAVLLGRLVGATPQILYATARRDSIGRQVAIGRALARAAEALGPVFVKLAQMVSYRADLLPPALIGQMARLQDHVAYSSSAGGLDTLEASLQRPISATFSSFDPNPIATGSIASVHCAQTHDGRKVAVKVVRAGVASLVRRDIACIRWVVALVSRARPLRGIPIAQTFEHIALMIESQTDMRTEARSLVRFKNMLKGLDAPRVPRLHDEFTSRDVLVMDFVDNARPLFSQDVGAEVFRAATRQILTALYQMILVDGLVHCDMHPGNFFIGINDNRAILLDAGLTAELTEVDRRCFRDFFLGLTGANARVCTSSIIDSALIVPADLDLRSLTKEVGAIVRSYTGRKTGDFLVAEFVFKIFDVQRRHGLFGAPGFASAIWALTMFEGLVRHRYPDLDFQAEARPFATAAILEDIRRYIGS